jgi:hypothetical protein
MQRSEVVSGTVANGVSCGLHRDHDHRLLDGCCPEVDWLRGLGIDGDVARAETVIEVNVGARPAAYPHDDEVLGQRIAVCIGGRCVVEANEVQRAGTEPGQSEAIVVPDAPDLNGHVIGSGEEGFAGLRVSAFEYLNPAAGLATLR